MKHGCTVHESTVSSLNKKFWKSFHFLTSPHFFWQQRAFSDVKVFIQVVNLSNINSNHYIMRIWFARLLWQWDIRQTTFTSFLFISLHTLFPVTWPSRIILILDVIVGIECNHKKNCKRNLSPKCFADLSWTNKFSSVSDGQPKFHKNTRPYPHCRDETANDFSVELTMHSHLRIECATVSKELLWEQEPPCMSMDK